MADLSNRWTPGEAITVIAGTPPGGGQDRVARALAAAIEADGRLGVPLEVVNVAGRGGGNGWDQLAARRADPHVVSVSSPTLVSNRVLGDPLDPALLTALPLLCTEYIAFLVRHDSALLTGPALVERLADGIPLPVSLATAVGNINHVAVGLVARHAGIQPGALPVEAFDSARLAVAALVEGTAEMAAVTAASALPELEAGTVRALAVSAPQRLPGRYSPVPTWVEHGVPCLIGSWRGVLGAPGLTGGQVGYWADILRRAAGRPEWRHHLDRHLWTETYLEPEEAASFMHEQIKLMRSMLDELGLLG